MESSAVQGTVSPEQLKPGTHYNWLQLNTDERGLAAVPDYNYNIIYPILIIKACGSGFLPFVYTTHLSTLSAPLLSSRSCRIASASPQLVILNTRAINLHHSMPDT